MSRNNWTALDCAKQYVGMKEVPGHQSNPAILAMLKLDAKWPEDDATPWCSAFANWVAFNMGLERTNDVQAYISGRLVKVPLLARAWLQVGKPISEQDARSGAPTGNAVVILSRTRWRPGPEVIAAPGHVGFIAGFTDDKVLVCGGNQGDKVSVKGYPAKHILGIRKLNRA